MINFFLWQNILKHTSTKYPGHKTETAPTVAFVPTRKVHTLTSAPSIIHGALIYICNEHGAIHHSSKYKESIKVFVHFRNTCLNKIMYYRKGRRYRCSVSKIVTFKTWINNTLEIYTRTQNIQVLIANLMNIYVFKCFFGQLDSFFDDEKAPYVDTRWDTPFFIQTCLNMNNIYR